MNDKILIINHDRDMTDVLEMIFIHQFYQVNICESLIDIEVLYPYKPDVVIIGLLHEDLTLAEVYQQIRDDESTRFVPVIHLSHQVDKEHSDDDNFSVVDPLNFYLLSNQVKDMIRKSA